VFQVSDVNYEVDIMKVDEEIKEVDGKRIKRCSRLFSNKKKLYVYITTVRKLFKLDEIIKNNMNLKKGITKIKC
jgi:hypothetical protein